MLSFLLHKYIEVTQREGQVSAAAVERIATVHGLHLQMGIIRAAAAVIRERFIYRYIDRYI
jgi:hypothetical protein